MSGGNSSGRSFSGGGGFGETPAQDCSTLAGVTKVISPTMIYFDSVSIGDILKVELDEGIIVLLNSLGDAVGGINPAWIATLIACINKGNKYEATIVKIEGAAIDVSIMRAK